MMSWKPVKPEASDFKCHKCGTNDELFYRMSEHDDYDDVNYWCKACGFSWWIEGSDY